jgi:hypothetical protein
MGMRTRAGLAAALVVVGVLAGGCGSGGKADNPAITGGASATVPSAAPAPASAAPATSANDPALTADLASVDGLMTSVDAELTTADSGLSAQEGDPTQ